MGQTNEVHASAHALVHDAEFQQLVRRKNTISTTLTLVMLVVYFGFAALLAWNPAALAAPFGSATLGIPVGIGIIVFAWILTGIYVRWANTKYDAMIAHLKQRVAAHQITEEATS